jgi:hypothetical protein
MIKLIKILLFFSLLQSCSSFGVIRSFSYLDGYIRGFESDKITKEYFDSSKYSFANVKIGRGPAATIILAYINDGVYEWRGADGTVFFTKNGQLIETLGLPYDISIDELKFSNKEEVRINSSSTFKEPLLLKAQTTNTIYLLSENFILDRADGQHVTSVYKVRKEIPSIKWRGTSRYYLDQNMRVLYAEEETHPFLPIIKIQYYYK